jgi:hypothetical protein
VVPFILYFVYISYLPIAPTIWTNIAAGKQMIATRALPHEISNMPLAAGSQPYRLAWLSDVIFGAAHNVGGVAAVSGLATMLMIVTTMVWATLLGWFTLQRRGLLLAVGLIAMAKWTHLDEPGSFHTGSLCLAVFCWMLFRPRSELLHPTQSKIAWTQWLGLVVLMIVWANVGPTFLFGVGVLFAIAIGNVIDRCRTETQQTRIFDDTVQRSFWLFELAAVATIVNPLGIRLWTNLFRISGNPFVAHFGNSAPLQLASFSGGVLAIAIVVLIIAIREADSVSVTVGLIAIGGTAAVAFNQNLLAWAVPLIVVVTIRLRRNDLPIARLVYEETVTAPGEHQPLQFAWSLVCVLLVWCGFALSPLSDPLLASKTRPENDWLSTETPTRLSASLQEHGPKGLVWSPAEWGDWISFGTPDTQVFTTSRFDLLPNHARRDYVKIFRGQHDWERAADRYAIQTLVINKRKQPTLARKARMSGDWVPRFEDRTAMIVTRKELR